MRPFGKTLAAKRKRAHAIFERLCRAYPEARCSLEHKAPLQLLVATILAAQCTDARVNIVTKSLFKKYKKPQDYLAAPPHELEEAVRTCGFYHTKAKSIINSCRRIVEVYGGRVPRTMEELLTLEGVGRKTANVILGECFNTPGVIVDTHCIRLSRRLGFTDQEDPAKIEKDLMAVWPQETWTLFSHCFVYHGRALCTARAPKCPECPIQELCPYGCAHTQE